ncbi:MAG: phenylacetic acid degradation bifunctional protein PaaZ [Exilibacterium sp.]
MKSATKTAIKTKSYICGEWFESAGPGTEIRHAVTGDLIAITGSEGIDFAKVLDYGRRQGGTALREMTIHERANALKQLGKYLLERKETFYTMSACTGATRADSWVDIEGGIGTLFSYSSVARRELTDETFIVEGAPERLAANNTFEPTHLVSVHINAFNFPCWGMLEKIAPSLVAGVPAVVKPATDSAYLAAAMVKEIVASGLLPEGAIQLICGRAGDLFDHLTEQDVVTFTGSADTGQRLRSHPNIIRKSIPFNMEADSLNCCILGQTVSRDDPEFDLFIKEVAREMTSKAGQKCTAIRRIIVPQDKIQTVAEALQARLDKVVMGDPGEAGVKMGALLCAAQKAAVDANVKALAEHCKLLMGGDDNFTLMGEKAVKDAFYPPTLFLCDNPRETIAPHTIEAFGPVSTLMPYRDPDDAIHIASLGKGSLVGSVFTHDGREAAKIILGCAAYHGRMLVIDRDCAGESTGHGSPLPTLVHGGPGRAGGAKRVHTDVHPFKKYFDDLQIGESLTTHRRTVTEADIVNFGCLSGDHFYAHFDELAAQDSLFGKRVAHGYFVISAAAGMFVEPSPGPVLANYGLENLRFIEPVGIGDTIQAKITVKQKIRKARREDEPQARGVVIWDVEVSNQNGEKVALYDVLTLVARRED